MSENQKHDDESTTQTPEQADDDFGGIGDDQLPEDLQPTEDNPLARHPGQTGDDADIIGSDTESGEAANPSTNMTYGSGPSQESGESAEDGQEQAEEDDGSDTLDNGGGAG